MLHVTHSEWLTHVSNLLLINFFFLRSRYVDETKKGCCVVFFLVFVMSKRKCWNFVYIDDVYIKLENIRECKRRSRPNQGFEISSKFCISDNHLDAVDRVLSAKKLTGRGLSQHFIGSIDRNSGVRLNEQEISSASFKRNFAASCLPSCVWNRSLPNLRLCLGFEFSPVGQDLSATYSNSVEYFTPEPNFVPKYGAYCMWSSNDDDDYPEGNLSFVCGANKTRSITFLRCGGIY